MVLFIVLSFSVIIKYIPLQQGLRQKTYQRKKKRAAIIKYIPLQQGLRLVYVLLYFIIFLIIKYIPLQQGLRQPWVSFCKDNKNY